jgi:S-methylmethionine-dependent homocysteine/selenocysteine methylase
MSGSPAFEHLRSLRDAGRTVVIDGAMGTELQARGVPMDEDAWCGGLARALGVYPHHGIWRQPNWTFHDVPVEQLVELAGSWMELGATMLGGCCRLRTHHVAALRELADSPGSA